MSRPATKRADIARALRIGEDQVLDRLRRVYAAHESIRDVCDWLTSKGVPTSKSWLQRELARPGEFK